MSTTTPVKSTSLGIKCLVLLGAVACLFAFAACGEHSALPTAPIPQPQTPPPTGFGGIGGYVFEVRDGSCLIGAHVEVLDGPRQGDGVQQTSCPFGDDFGYSFWNLPLDRPVTIRASAPGYIAVERQMFPSSQVGQTNFILIKQ